MGLRFVVIVALLVLNLRERPVPPPVVAPTPAVSFTIAITPAPIVPPAQPAASSPPATATRASCPPPRTDASLLPRDHALPHGVSKVAASVTNAGWLAVWDAQHVLVSFDAGLTFARVLDGPGEVSAVTFDCYGHVVALRSGKVGIREGAREHWRAVPGLRGGDAPATLIGGGPDVIALGIEPDEAGHARAAISSDLGATWWYRELIPYWESAIATGRQDADGTIHFAVTSPDCMTEAVTWFRIKRGGIVERDELGTVGPIALFDDVAIVATSDGVSWKRLGDAAWRAATGLPDDREDPQVTLVEGPLPRIIADGVLYRFSRGALRPVRALPHKGSAAVDRAGRLWAIDETKDGEDAWLVALR